MEKCQFCKNVEFSNQKSRKSHEFHCKKFFDQFPNIDPIEIESRYKRGESPYEIADSLFINRHQIYRVFRKLGVEIRSNKESSNDPLVREKTRITNIKKYGSDHNFRKDHPSRKEWERKMIETEGIVNVGQRESVKNSIKKTIAERYGVNHYMELDFFKDKIKETGINKYGVDHPMKSERIRDELFQYLINKYGTFFPSNRQFSKIHKKVCELLQDNGIKFINEYKIRDKSRLYFYDILIEGTNKIIEVNGDYWHCNPEIYKPDDFFISEKFVH